MTCVCGSQNWQLESSGGLVINASAITWEPPTRGEGGLAIGGSASFDILNDLSFGYHHLMHLQDNGTPYDNDGDGIDGTSSKPPYRKERGLYGGYCQEFRGFEFIDISSDSIDQNKPWTFSGWVSLDSFHRQNYLFVHGENRIWWNVLNQFQFSTKFTGEDSTTWATSSTIHQNNCWHHVCIVYRPSTSIEVWIDGEREKKITISKNLPSASSSTIGRDKMNQAKAEGRMQEVRLRYGAMDETAIEYEYHIGCGRDFVGVGVWEGA